MNNKSKIDQSMQFLYSYKPWWDIFFEDTINQSKDKSLNLTMPDLKR